MGVGTISVRQAVSMLGTHAQKKHLASRLQAHRQILLTALDNRELALENRELELQNKKLRQAVAETNAEAHTGLYPTLTVKDAIPATNAAIGAATVAPR